MRSGPSYSFDSVEMGFTEEARKILTAIEKFDPLQSVVSVRELRGVHPSGNDVSQTCNIIFATRSARHERCEYG